jgi:hypothetical protein
LIITIITITTITIAIMSDTINENEIKWYSGVECENYLYYVLTLYNGRSDMIENNDEGVLRKRYFTKDFNKLLVMIEKFKTENSYKVYKIGVKDAFKIIRDTEDLWGLVYSKMNIDLEWVDNT